MERNIDNVNIQDFNLEQVIVDGVADNVGNDYVTENLENQIGVEARNIDNEGIQRMVGALQIADISVDNGGTYNLGSGNDALNVHDEEVNDNVSVLSREEKISKSVSSRSRMEKIDNRLDLISTEMRDGIDRLTNMLVSLINNKEEVIKDLKEYKNVVSGNFKSLRNKVNLD